jgi:two-component sensor histidine kinase
MNSRTKVLGYGAAIWTAFGVMLTLQFYLHDLLYGERASLVAAASNGLIDIYLWALTAVTAFVAARWISLERFSLGRVVLIHLALGPTVVLARTLLDLLAVYIFAGRVISLLEQLLLTFTLRLMVFYAFLGAGYAVEYFRRFHERQLREIHLREQLTRAQLGMLKMQLQPHFLFNTLHAVSSLMRSDVAGADRMLSRLADMLRQTLQSSETQFVRLEEEIETLQPYLEIERIRFGERLRVQVELGACRDAIVPHMLLQPLVENAIRHGIAPLEGGGLLSITASRRHGSLVLRVRDTGRGLRPGAVDGHGVGLSNTRQRLRHLYGDGQAVELLPGSDGAGVTVVIEIPFRPAPVPGAVDPLVEPPDFPAPV